MCALTVETTMATGQLNSKPFSSEVFELQQSVHRLAQKATLLYRVRACLLWLVVALASLLGLVALDFVLRTEELGLRWLLTLSWLAILCMAGLKWLLPARQFGLSPIQVASWIEAQRPELSGSLSNVIAIAYLPVDDPRYGSSSLRAAALESIPPDLVELPWHRYLSYKAFGHAAWMISSICLLIGILAVVHPNAVGLGLKRLLFPWRDAPWPRADQLVFQQLPAMISSGSDLHVEVIDLHPPLPMNLDLEIRKSKTTFGALARDGTVRSQPLRVSGEIAYAIIPQVVDGIAIRAVGGDDRDTSWHEVRVVELPELVEHDYYVEPPAYSRQPSGKLVGQRIEVLTGSKVTFRGRFDGQIQQVDAVSVSRNPNQGANDDNGLARTPDSKWRGDLSSDRQAFSLFSQLESEQTVERDRSWKLNITSIDGLEITAPTVWTIHCVPDRPPSVSLAPLEPNWITQNSSIIIVGQAADDLELIEVRLVWRVGEDEIQSRTLLSQGINSQDELNDRSEADAIDQSRRLASIEYSWTPVLDRHSTAQQLSLYLEARDSLGQISRSEEQKLQIQDQREVLAKIETEETKAFEPLRQLLEAQQRNQQSIQRMSEIFRETRHLAVEQLDILAAALQLEQSIAHQLAISPESLQEKLAQLSRQLDQNGLSDTTLAKQIAAMSETIEKISRETILPAIEELERSHTIFSDTLEKGDAKAGIAAISEGLDRTATSQRKATSELSKLVESISNSESYARFQKRLTELVVRQQELRASTERFQVDRMTRPDARTNDANRVGIRLDQQNLATQVDSVVDAIEKMIKNADVDPKARAALDRARKSLIDGRASDTMREVAQNVNSHQITEALRSQHVVSAVLEKAANLVTNRSEGTLASSVDSLQSLADKLGQLADDESTIADQLRRSPSPIEAEEIAKEQSTLAEQTKELDQQMQQANEAMSELLRQAEVKVANSSRLAREKKFQESANEAQDAAEQLRSAQQTAEQRASNLKNQLAEQQLLDLATAVTELIRKQVQVVEKLDDVLAHSIDLKKSPDAWSNAVRESAGSQELVRQLVFETSKQTKALVAFQWLFKQCELDMTRAIAALEREKLAPDAIRSANNALEKLEAAAAALTQPHTEPKAKDNPSDQAKEDGQEKDTQRQPSLASLRLLRALQNVLRDRTAQLERQVQDPSSTEMVELAQQQEALAELTSELLKHIMK